MLLFWSKTSTPPAATNLKLWRSAWIGCQTALNPPVKRLVCSSFRASSVVWIGFDWIPQSGVGKVPSGFRAVRSTKLGV